MLLNEFLSNLVLFDNFFLESFKQCGKLDSHRIVLLQDLLELFFGLPPSELASFKSDFDQFRHI